MNVKNKLFSAIVKQGK